MDIPGLSHDACTVGCPKRVRGQGAKIERREEKERGDEERNAAELTLKDCDRTI